MSTQDLLNTLKLRFESNMRRHEGLEWNPLQRKLVSNPDKLRALAKMEKTGGEPDVIGFDEDSGEYIFCDCSAETPLGRRNTCYDSKGQQEREKKGIHPSGNACAMADEIGIELLTENQYRRLQMIGEFDLKTSSWLKTPDDIRKLGGAIFGDRRYGKVFKYHNSAPSFYSSRGFRGILKI